MVRRRVLRSSDREYWPQVCIALSQVTFGVAWATLFLSLDSFKIGVVILNLTITALLIRAGRNLRRKI